MVVESVAKLKNILLILSISPLLYLFCFPHPITALECFKCEYEETSQQTKPCLRPTSPTVNKVPCETGQISCETTVILKERPSQMSIRRGCSTIPANRTCEFPLTEEGDKSCFCDSDVCNNRYPFVERRCVVCTFVENVTVGRSTEDLACSIGAMEYANVLCPDGIGEPMSCIKVSGVLDVQDAYVRVIQRECTTMKDDGCSSMNTFVSTVNHYVKLKSAVGCVCDFDNCNNKAGWDSPSSLKTENGSGYLKYNIFYSSTIFGIPLILFRFHCHFQTLIEYLNM